MLGAGPQIDRGVRAWGGEGGKAQKVGALGTSGIAVAA